MKRISTWLTFLLIFGFVVILIGGVAGYFITQQPDSAFTKTVVVPVLKPFVDLLSGFSQHKNVEQSEAQFVLKPDELHEAYGKNESEAKAQYEGKIVQVNGIISSIASPTDTNIVVLLTIERDPMSNISCQMDPSFNERLEGLAAGSKVSIKGICNGAKKDDLLGSLDVLLNRCVIVE